MADNVMFYWVTKNGAVYCAALGSRTYVHLSTPERVEASKRMMDFAGLPHKVWPHGEPSTMEEFGVELVSNTKMNEHSSEARRMLGVLLGWNNPQDNSPEAGGLDRLRGTPYQVVVDESTGWWYAYAPGTFFHINSMDHFGWLRAGGFVPDASANRTLYHNMVQFIHDECLRGGDRGRIEEVEKPPPPKTHIVAKGETLGGIAKQYNVTVADLVSWNKLKDANSIDLNQVLQITPG